MPSGRDYGSQWHPQCVPHVVAPVTFGPTWLWFRKARWQCHHGPAPGLNPVCQRLFQRIRQIRAERNWFSDWRGALLLAGGYFRKAV